MEEIKKFKFAANLEFVSEELQKRKIIHYTDFENSTLLSEKSRKNEILKIIDELKLDENEVEVDGNAIEGYKEWTSNMYNPGHFTGGKTPYFQIDNNNYLTLGLLTLLSGIVALLQLVNDSNFSKTGFWLSFVVIILISSSMFYQYFKFKKKNR